jgi:hypothetical protein
MSTVFQGGEGVEGEGQINIKEEEITWERQY